jgi:hypothetical protein
LADTIAESDL